MIRPRLPEAPRASLGLLRAYRPKPWNGEVVLFRSPDDPDFSKIDPSLDWTGTSLPGIKLIDCPGTQMPIMKGRSFEALLQQVIRRA